MDVLINVLLLGAIGLFVIIMIDYMHRMAHMSYTRIAAIMSPVFVVWAFMLYLVITYK